MTTDRRGRRDRPDPLRQRTWAAASSTSPARRSATPAPTPGLAVHDVDGFVSYHVEQVAEVELLDDARHARAALHGAHAVGRRRRGVDPRPGRARGRAAAPPSASSRSVPGTVRRQASYGADPNQGGRPWAKGGARLRDSRQWHHPFGVAAPAQEMALIARRHMHVYGTRAEHFGMQAVAQRFHAEPQPRRDHARGDHARRLGRVAPDRRADPAVRLLARERRCGRGARDVARAGPRSRAARGAGARAGAVRRADPHGSRRLLRDHARVRRAGRRRGRRGAAPVRARPASRRPTSTWR